MMDAKALLTKADFNLQTPNILCKAATYKDLPTIYNLEKGDEFQEKCVINNNFPKNLEEYKERYKKIYSKFRFMHFLLFTRKGIPFGTIFFYQKSDRHRLVYFNVYLKKDYRTKPGTWKVIVTLLDHLFYCIDIHKIYTQIFEGNDFSLQNAEKMGFEVEGFLSEHYIKKDGQRMGVYICSLFRRKFEEMKIFNKTNLLPKHFIRSS